MSLIDDVLEFQRLALKFTRLADALAEQLGLQQPAPRTHYPYPLPEREMSATRKRPSDFHPSDLPADYTLPGHGHTVGMVVDYPPDSEIPVVRTADPSPVSSFGPVVDVPETNPYHAFQERERVSIAVEDMAPLPTILTLDDI